MSFKGVKKFWPLIEARISIVNCDHECEWLLLIRVEWEGTIILKLFPQFFAQIRLTCDHTGGGCPINGKVSKNYPNLLFNAERGLESLL